MKNNHITTLVGVIGLSSIVGLGTVSAKKTPPSAHPAAAPTAPALPKLTDKEAKEISSYILGFQQAQGFKRNGLELSDIDPTLLSKGLIEGLKANKPSYSNEKIQAALQTLSKKVHERAAKKAAANLEAGKKFLEKNAKRKGVITTKSGLQYEIINKGGDKKYVAPKDGAQDTTTEFFVNYRGTLIDGTEFDKSPKGTPLPITLHIFPGFKEALKMMPVGAKWKLFIPSNLAYGPRPAGPKIGPNSVLIFDLELVKIQKAPKQPKATQLPSVPLPTTKKTAATPPVKAPAPSKKKSEKAK